MPPKREAGTTATQPPMKILKVDSDVQVFGCDPDEERYRPSEEASYSAFSNNENEVNEFDEENDGSPGMRTDTISLLMKIDQLQAQLKYERRCRVLAERELRELKEMNTLMMQMRHTAHELRVTLNHVLQEREETLIQQTSQDETLSFSTPPEAEIREVHQLSEDNNNILFLAENLRIPRNLYEPIAEIADYKKYISALLMILFDRETLATHSLQGRRGAGDECHKPQLPPDILKGIIDHVSTKFGVDCSQIRTAIRTKLNNEDKLLKKRLGLIRHEHRASLDPNLCQDSSLLADVVS
ncbi:uncharacterized protein LOC103385744 [Cynoglossus semilaevis]|uniref:uncharacterized protein LOC103385744 n=1 Tax=Cynoglossus semilaevis TaxID=244447 RepID=UPI000497622B|nr:uncharacterized protein LOC103385744 [Cynoglossus semilaevis]XP_016891844.1 uncharacterized protein LOC103385744 [Cynoglossus semilaevis]